MIDVVPAAEGGWMASCECTDSMTYATQEEAWRWLIDHSCPALMEQRDDEFSY